MRILVTLAVLLLAGCYEVQQRDLTEEAVVRDVIYAPSQHGSGSGVGMSMSGNLVVTSNSVSIPAKYAVVFECQHGKFIVEGESKRHKELWQRLKAGQKVTVSYQEVWRIHDDGRRELAKLKFVDAR